MSRLNLRGKIAVALLATVSPFVVWYVLKFIGYALMFFIFLLQAITGEGADGSYVYA
jgi:hypothetical protein